MRANIRKTLKRQVGLLPEAAGVYLFRNRRGTLLYIGKADHLKQRVQSYFSQKPHSHPRTRRLAEQIATVETVVTTGRREALVLEATLIKRHRPKYNVNLRDGQRYPFVCLTGSVYPRVMVTRVPDTAPGPCFGPFTSVRSLRMVLRLLRAVVPLRTCSDSELTRRERPCVLYQMKRCLGPCVYRGLESEYAGLVDLASRILQGRVDAVVRALEVQMHDIAQALRFEEAAVIRDRINALLKLRERQRVVLKRKSNLDLFALARAGTMALAVVHEVREGFLVGQRVLPLAGVDNETEPSQVMEAVLTQYYIVSQRAPSRILLSVMPTGNGVIEDWLSSMTGGTVRLRVPKGGIGGELVQSALRNANVALEEEVARKGSWDHRVPESLIKLGELLGTSPPRIIVGMDVSNLSGKESVGSVVMFREGVPWKQEYRRYKLDEDFSDDTERLYSMAVRWAKRAASGEHPTASVLLVDGGSGQVSAVSAAIRTSTLSEKPMIVGLAKKEELLHIEKKETSIKLRRDDEGLQLLQRIRDESHRFAVGYHRSVRRKKLFRDPLQEIPGIGKARARALRRRFGGMEGLRSAPLDDIVSIAGIGPRLAKAIQSTIEGG